MADKTKVLVPADERSQVARAVCAWINTCPHKPVKKIGYEYIGETGVMVSTQANAYKTRQYIDGSYQAQYPFYVIYRAVPTSDDGRLKMDECLEKIAAWCETSLPSLNGNMTAQTVVCNTSSAMVARYDDNSEDHQISLTLTYEVQNG